jgi:hypothetical protein
MSKDYFLDEKENQFPESLLDECYPSYRDFRSKSKGCSKLINRIKRYLDLYEDTDEPEEKLKIIEQIHGYVDLLKEKK